MPPKSKPKRNMTMTTRIYKNEYQPNHVDFLKSTFTVVDESENILTISGDAASLERAMCGMFNNDDQFKSLFPSFQTMAERTAYTRECYHTAVKAVQTELLNMINHGVVNDDFFRLRELWQQMESKNK